MKLVLLFSGLWIAAVFPGRSQVTPAQLIEDIGQLQQLIETKHIAPFRLVTKDDFQLTVSAAKKAINAKKVCDETCYVELLKIIAALNDGHSVMASSSREKLFGYLPVTTTWFREGLYVTRVPEANQNILGARLEAIDEVPIDSVLKKLRTVLPHANASRFKKFAYSYLRMPGLLYGLGITKDSKEASFTVSMDGKHSSVLFRNMDDATYEQTEFIEYVEIATKTPLYSKRDPEYYWDQYDSINHIFYFKYNRIGNMKTERASAFAERMWAQVDSLQPDKFVMDIRNNGGGNFAFSMSFIQGILDRPKINKRGKLFIISGYDTFSAALAMLRNLELKSNAIILGEPPGDYAASSGDPKTYVLENSGIEVHLSSVFHETIFPDDMRKEIVLDRFIETPWRDYSKGVDPVYEYIKNYDQPLPMKVPANDYAGNIGSYSYDTDKNIAIRAVDDTLYFEISHSLISPLYRAKGESFHTEVNGLTVQFIKNAVKLNFPDGKTGIFQRTAAQKSVLDLLYSGEFEAAKTIYLTIKKNDPNSTLIRDGRFSSHALFAFFELRKQDRAFASTIAKGILNLGIELNDGDAPFCEYAMRFY